VRVVLLEIGSHRQAHQRVRQPVAECLLTSRENQFPKRQPERYSSGDGRGKNLKKRAVVVRCSEVIYRFACEYVCPMILFLQVIRIFKSTQRKEPVRLSVRLKKQYREEPEELCMRFALNNF